MLSSFTSRVQFTMSNRCDATRICDASPPANIRFPELSFGSPPTPAPSLAPGPPYSSSPVPGPPYYSPLAPAPSYSSPPAPAPPYSSPPAPAPPYSSPPAPAPLYSSLPAPAVQNSPPPPPAPHNLELTPPVPTAPPAHRSVVGVAAGSAAAAAILVVLALGLYLAMARRKRRAGRRGGRAAAGNIPVTGSGSSSEKHPSIDVVYPPPSPAAPPPREPQKQQSIELSPPPASSDSSATPLAVSRESVKSLSHHPHKEPGGQPVPGGEILFRGAFTYGELAAATNGFSDANLVGRGGFGDVYVGTVDSAAVAVKRLRAGSQQGDREFQAELQIIRRVHHRNLVSLVGYCVADGGQRLLVYEFVANMSLENHLHGGLGTVLDWPTRWRIAVGAAKGLAYLHEDCHPRIIHRDIKAANILLDPDFNPKVSDFGMAKFIPGGDAHISTRIVGTIGYLAPEYAISGRLTDKSDVFSFGVVLLEIITGMDVTISSNPDTDGTLVGWARPLLTWALELGDYDELVDPLLLSFDAEQMARLVRCTAAAVSPAAPCRPRMSQIVRHLEGDASTEEIDACGAQSFGEGGSAYRDTTVQSHPTRYNEIRTSRREARVSKQHQR